jgi:hypothetical protein
VTAQAPTADLVARVEQSGLILSPDMPMLDHRANSTDHRAGQEDHARRAAEGEEENDARSEEDPGDLEPAQDAVIGKVHVTSLLVRIGRLDSGSPA